MNPYMQAILVPLIALTSAALVVVAFELRSIRDILTTERIKVETYKPKASPTRTTVVSSPGGYAIFIFRQGHWILESDLSKPGYEAVAPSVAGTFEGQVVKKESALMREGVQHV